MRRLAIFVLLILAITLDAGAVVASRTSVKYTQPDGSVITITRHGDEFHHWTTTSDGTIVCLCSDGYYRPQSDVATKSSDQASSTRRSAASTMRKAAMKSSMSEGKKHFLVMLIEFSDLQFSSSDAAGEFRDMMMLGGYSENGGTGSCRDYYYENSGGKFDPVFDVVGPVKVSRGYAYYGRNVDGSDVLPDSLLVEACRLVDEDVDFSIYDNDGDGIIDNVFYYYAGYNEAEGGSEDTIWPHSYAITSNVMLDGKRLYSYACSSELTGTKGTVMCGIGTFCHEFAHVLGLPDFYDTDYEENGMSPALYNFSLMCEGNYNNSGRTPPYLTSIEKYLLGWGEWPTLLSEAGSVTLPSVQTGAAYYTDTTNEGEYYIFETRGGKGWDAPVAEGMVVYHLDSSDNMVGGQTAKNRWYYGNGINAYRSHQCYYVVDASGSASSYSHLVFPGASSATSFTPDTTPAFVDWAGNSEGMSLTGISYADGVTSFNVEVDRSKTVSGKVLDSSGKPVANVTVTVSTESQTKTSADGMRSMKVIQKASSHEAVTGEDGAFSIDLSDIQDSSYELMATLRGYVPYTETIRYTGAAARRNIVMRTVDEGAESSDLKKYSAISGYGLSPGITSYDLAACFSGDDLKDYEGCTIQSISFLIYSESCSELYAIADAGNRNILSHKVTNPSLGGSVTTVDVSEDGFTIPSGTKLYVGYAVSGLTDSYSIAIDADEAKSGGLCITSYSPTTPRNWMSYDSYGNAIISMKVRSEGGAVHTLGFCTISNPSGGYYSDGDTFSLTLTRSSRTPKSTTWYYDGTQVSGSSVTLRAGVHTVKAVLIFDDGTRETLIQRVEVE